MSMILDYDSNETTRFKMDSLLVLRFLLISWCFYQKYFKVTCLSQIIEFLERKE